MTEKRVDPSDYERILKTAQQSQEMTSTQGWKVKYEGMIRSIREAKEGIKTCEKKDLEKYQAAIKVTETMIEEEVEKVEVLNTFITSNPLFSKGRDDLFYGKFDFKVGEVQLLPFSGTEKPEVIISLPWF